VTDWMKKNLDVKTIVLFITIISTALGNFQVNAHRLNELEQVVSAETGEHPAMWDAIKANSNDINLLAQHASDQDTANKDNMQGVRDDIKTIKEDIKTILQKLP